MSEQKVWVEKMPESCKSCQFQCYGECRNGCDILKTDYSMTQCHIMRGKHTDCPLIDIKTHDREVVKEVCEKIRTELENETETYCEIRQCSSPHYQGDYVWFNYVKFGIFIAQILKEFEK